MNKEINIFGEWTDQDLKAIIPAFRSDSISKDKLANLSGGDFDYRFRRFQTTDNVKTESKKHHLLKAEAEHLEQKVSNLSKIAALLGGISEGNLNSHDAGMKGSGYFGENQIRRTVLSIRFRRIFAAFLFFLAICSVFVISTRVTWDSYRLASPREVPADADDIMLAELEGKDIDSVDQRKEKITQDHFLSFFKSLWEDMRKPGATVPVVIGLGMLTILCIGLEVHGLFKILVDKGAHNRTKAVLNGFGIVSWSWVSWYLFCLISKMIVDGRAKLLELAKTANPSMSDYNILYGAIISEQINGSIKIELALGLLMGVFAFRNWHKAGIASETLQARGRYPQCEEELKSTRARLLEVVGEIEEIESRREMYRLLKTLFVTIHVARMQALIMIDLKSQQNEQSAFKAKEGRIAAEALVQGIRPALEDIRSILGDAHTTISSLSKAGPLRDISSVADRIDELFESLNKPQTTL